MSQGSAKVPNIKMPGLPVPGPSRQLPRVLVAGDTHGNLAWISTLAKLAARHNCDGIVVLGDFGFWSDSNARTPVLDDRWLTAVATAVNRFGIWLRTIDGNHDAVPLVLDRYHPDEAGIVSIRDGLLDWATRGTRWDWAGVRFGALGGAVSVDKRLRRPGWTWWATEEITPGDVSALGDDPLDVLLTHDAPEGVSHPGVDATCLPVQFLQEEAESRAQRRLVEQARRATRPVLHLHGHHHLRYRAVVDGGGVPTTVEGLDCDRAANGGAWGMLDLVALQAIGTGFADGWEVVRARDAGRPIDYSRVGRSAGN